MKYTEITPGAALRQYIQCYYIFEAANSFEMEDTVFPGGQMEVIFNLGEAVWQSAVNDSFVNTPAVELWGQVTQPLPVRTIGNNCMLGIRFFPHAAACFFKENIWELNDQIIDLVQVLGSPAKELHAMLLVADDRQMRIDLVENFLIKRLHIVKRKPAKVALIGNIITDIRSDFLPNKIETIADHYGMSSRYLHKLFLQYTGVSPKFYDKLNRFQKSLKMVQQNKLALTEIAYESGYFDQSHFIREFKSFTGDVPSAYAHRLYPFNQTFSQT